MQTRETQDLSLADQHRINELNRTYPHLIESLRGEKCTQVHFSYGDELCLGFGPLSPCQHPKLTHLQRGTWELCTRATPWKIFRGGKVVLNSEDPKTDEEIAEIKARTQDILQDKTLQNLTLDPETLETNLSFAGSFSHYEDYSLILYPDLWGEDQLQHWVLWMPSEQVLTIGPSYQWSYRSMRDRA